MDIPSNLGYTKDHEWADIKGEFATIGITNFAQSELGDIVFVEFPEIGDTFKAGDAFGTIEAVKTVTDIYAPLSGKVVEINAQLDIDPSKINSDPFGAGWIIKMKLSDMDEKESLMDALSYEDMLG